MTYSVEDLSTTPKVRRVSANTTSEGLIMIILGVILIVLGFVLPSLIPTFAFAHVLLVIGVILLIVGIILAVLGSAGRAVGGRRHYY
jgi:uncharacterized membrane protein HdeD (DUF308 family)